MYLMETLPNALENIILDYKVQMELYETKQQYMVQVLTLIRRFKMQFQMIANAIAPMIPNNPDLLALQTLVHNVQGRDLNELIDVVFALVRF